MNKEQQIEEMARVVCEHFDCDMVGQPCTKCKTYDKHCYTIHQAEILYNAGYRKTFTSDFASDTQKAYKEGYIKGIEETEAEIERLKSDNEALTMWNNTSAETIQKLSETNKRFASNMKSVLEIEKKNAVKEFAEKLKMKAFNKDMFNDWAGATYVVLVREIDKLLKEYEK